MKIKLPVEKWNKFSDKLPKLGQEILFADKDDEWMSQDFFNPKYLNKNNGYDLGVCYDCSSLRAERSYGHYWTPKL